ncbi:MAG: hypothetical protein M5R36_12780 [Deltaproteobacteria bacterium]|nr:hypothetical protein [Deltaproteobacteria bacterium]
MKRASMMLIVASMSALPWTARAADDPDEKAFRKIEMVRMWKLAEVLDLDDAEMAKVVPALREYDRTLHAKAKERETLVGELRKTVASGAPDEKIIKESVRRILRLENEITGIREKHYQQMEKLLDAERLAKYMIFEVTFHDEVQKFVRDVRQRRDKIKRRLRGQGPGDGPAAGGEGAPPTAPWNLN